MNNCLKMRNLMLKEIPVSVKYATEVKEADIEIALVFSLGNYFLKNRLLEHMFIPFTRL